mmetsp:Transcript_21979/g.52776  ORF Transcript_21979/g.52776 Transcript_21979/m.52776 type:complete len:224 (+) Transcript_21979:1021-1692(+)
MRSWKDSCSTSWTPFSHRGKWWRSLTSMFCQHSSHLRCKLRCCPCSGLLCRQSYRSARIYVESLITASSPFSPSRFCISPRTQSDSGICLISPYLSRPQRARHSQNSSKSSVAMAWPSLASPDDIWSSDCEFRNAIFASRIVSRHENFSLHRSSPVISDSRFTVQSPTSAPSPSFPSSPFVLIGSRFFAPFRCLNERKPRHMSSHVSIDILFSPLVLAVAASV